MKAVLDLLATIWLALAGHLWQTTLILALLLLLGRRMRHAPAALLHVLWMAAFVKVFLPMALFGRLVEKVILVFDPGFGAQAAGTRDLAVWGGMINPTVVLRSDGSGGGLLIRMLPLFLTLIWAAGAFCGLRVLLRSYNRTRRWNGRMCAALTPADRRRLEGALSGTSIPPDRVMVVEALSLPCVSGLVRPRILVPERLLPVLAPEELRALLLHEDAHRRRREPLRSAALSFCSALCFFYPLLTVIRRRLEHTTELLCDAQVLRSGIHPSTYASALARAVRIGMEPESPTLAFAGKEGPSLCDRLQRIQAPRRYVAMKHHYLIVALVVGLITLGAFLPLQLITGCGHEQQRADTAVAPSSVAPSQATSASAAPAGDNAAIGASGATDKRPGPDEFVAVEEMPVLITPPVPEYPQAAKDKEIEGTVQLRLLVGKDGKVIDAFVSTHADPLLDEAALTAVRKAEFKPATQHGKPVAVWVQVPIKFSLN
jgi:TonB family protein